MVASHIGAGMATWRQVLIEFAVVEIVHARFHGESGGPVIRVPAQCNLSPRIDFLDKIGA